MPILQANEIELYYEIYGTGEPLVLLSGLATDSQSWVGCIDKLSHHYQVITLDNRGCGRTTPQETATSIALMAKDVITLLDNLNISQAHILGNSMGGFIALELAINFPKRVNKLIIEASAGKNTPANKELFEEWAQNLEKTDNLHDWYRETFKWIFHHKIFKNPKSLEAKLTYAARYPYQQSAAAFRNQLKAVNEFDASNDILKINAETLILCGEEDRLFNSFYIRQTLKDIPNSQIHIIHNAAHAIHIDNPQSFIENVMNFLTHS